MTQHCSHPTRHMHESAAAGGGVNRCNAGARASEHMITAIANTGRALHAVVRGDGTALTKEDLSQTISFARITLIVGLVFLHYEWFPNGRISPFRGFDPTQNQVATFVLSF